MNKRIVKNNIKSTLFFSCSVIFSTVFFVGYLALKNECWDIENEVALLQKSKNQYQNKIKSLKRQRDLLVRSAEHIAIQDYGFIVPDPEPLVIIMDDEE